MNIIELLLKIRRPKNEDIRNVRLEMLYFLRGHGANVRKKVRLKRRVKDKNPEQIEVVGRGKSFTSKEDRE